MLLVQLWECQQEGAVRQEGGVHPQKEGVGAAPRWFQPRDHVSSPTDWGEGPAFLCDHVPNPSKGLPMGMWVLDAGTDLQALCQ